MLQLQWFMHDSAPNHQEIHRGSPEVTLQIDPTLRQDIAPDLMMLIEDSRATIQRYQPDNVPASPTEVTYTHGVFKGQGRYAGVWQGRHHVVLAAVNDAELVNSLDRERLRFVLAHELLHQKQAEIGVPFRRHDLDEALQKPFFAARTPFELAMTFSALAGDLSGIQSTLTEGMAVMAELRMLESAIQDADNQERLILEELLRERQAQIEGDDRYDDGLRVAVALEPLGINNFARLWKRINWEACGRVRVDSPEYKSILEDPRRILALR